MSKPWLIALPMFWMYENTHVGSRYGVCGLSQLMRKTLPARLKRRSKKRSFEPVS
jgi:hypothetical protein